MDNASNNDSMASQLRGIVAADRFVDWSGKQHRLRCMAHTVQVALGKFVCPFCATAEELRKAADTAAAILDNLGDDATATTGEDDSEEEFVDTLREFEDDAAELAKLGEEAQAALRAEDNTARTAISKVRACNKAACDWTLIACLPCIPAADGRQ
jgi:hypothetical protein